MLVKITVPFSVPNIVGHLIFWVPQKGKIILTATHINPALPSVKDPEPENYGIFLLMGNAGFISSNHIT